MTGGMGLAGALCSRFAVDPWRREDRELGSADEWKLRRWIAGRGRQRRGVGRSEPRW